MLVMCYELLSQRPDILAGWQKRFRYILIDEFQDINQIQYDTIRLLAAPENNLFIVGDAHDQSIYRFRGARPEIMLNFKKDYPEAETVTLAENYRLWKISSGRRGRSSRITMPGTRRISMVSGKKESLSRFTAL